MLKQFHISFVSCEAQTLRNGGPKKLPIEPEIKRKKPIANERIEQKWQNILVFIHYWQFCRNRKDNNDNKKSEI